MGLVLLVFGPGLDRIGSEWIALEFYYFTHSDERWSMNRNSESCMEHKYVQETKNVKCECMLMSHSRSDKRRERDQKLSGVLYIYFYSTYQQVKVNFETNRGKARKNTAFVWQFIRRQLHQKQKRKEDTIKHQCQFNTHTCRCCRGRRRGWRIKLAAITCTRFRYRTTKAVFEADPIAAVIPACPSA